jgi:ABC-type multidrug transport system ATPase subunit
MDEADRCDRVALMQGGRLLAVDTPDAIARSFDHPLLAVSAARRYPTLLALRESPHVHAVYPFGAALHYVDRRAGQPLASIADELRAFLASRGFADVTVEPTPPTVEDSFIARMGAPDGTRAA